MKYVVRYETVASRAADLASVFPRHKAYLDTFAPASEVIGIGILEDPVTNGSMAIFASLDSAQRFVASDPFVVEGLVRPASRWAGAPEKPPEPRVTPGAPFRRKCTFELHHR